MKIENNSPSNIRTGWNQKYFYKVESDGMLDELIGLFAKNGNRWSMKKEAFDKLVAKKRLDQYFSFALVSDEVLEIDGEFIRFRNHVAEELLTYSWRWSLRNALKNLKRSVAAEMLADAWAFVVDPDARRLSDFRYDNGNGMSVRCAKKAGLIK